MSIQETAKKSPIHSASPVLKVAMFVPVYMILVPVSIAVLFLSLNLNLAH